MQDIVLTDSFGDLLGEKQRRLKMQFLALEQREHILSTQKQHRTTHLCKNQQVLRQILQTHKRFLKPYPQLILIWAKKRSWLWPQNFTEHCHCVEYFKARLHKKFHSMTIWTTTYLEFTGNSTYSRKTSRNPQKDKASWNITYFDRTHQRQKMVFRENGKKGEQGKKETIVLDYELYPLLMISGFLTLTSLHPVTFSASSGYRK